jgi:perosamine synthetase
MEFIPVNEPLLNGNEKKYLIECIETGWVSSEGPFVKMFENNMASYCNRKYAAAVCNGSVALDIAVRSLGIHEGDEVIMPTFTIISCVAAIIRAGAKPVLVDADPKNWNMNVAQIENKITAKTKAIMVVHIYGLPVDMNKVLEIAKKNNLKVIEDAAEAHGLEYNGKKCGSFGDTSTFSFYSNKNITTGEGGMILTDCNSLKNKFVSFRNLCHRVEKRFVHDELGWNFRMSNLQAAVGVAQLERLNKTIVKKREIGKKYTELLAEIDEIELPISKTDYADNIYWVFGIVLKDKVQFNADEARRRLKEKGIGTRPFFYPMHNQPIFKKMGLFINECHSVSERIADRGFYIPSGFSLNAEQMKIVVNKIKEIF